MNSLTGSALYFLSSAMGLTMTMAIGAWAGWVDPFWVPEKGGAMMVVGLLLLAAGSWPLFGIHQLISKRSPTVSKASRRIMVGGFGCGVLMLPCFFAIVSLYYSLPVSQEFQPIILLAVLAAPIGACVSALLAVWLESLLCAGSAGSP